MKDGSIILAVFLITTNLKGKKSFSVSQALDFNPQKLELSGFTL